ncbi:hypothetical protein M9Y10_000783 [Tritrichomonas musculus]|uniref:Uncharacterized protein n=1 Tax=Tritrichomonas musculus TaxID=1915356 RepID=A0ABR2L559_9EUKA
MDVYKNIDTAEIPKAQQYFNDQTATILDNDEQNELPEGFLIIEQIINKILELYDTFIEACRHRVSDKSRLYYELSEALFALAQSIQQFSSNVNLIIQLILKIDQKIAAVISNRPSQSNQRYEYEPPHSFFEYLLYILEIRESQQIVKSELFLFEKITSLFPFEFWRPLFCDDILAALIDMITHPSKGLNNLTINNNIVHLDFTPDDTFFVRKLVVTNLYRFLYQIHQKYQIDTSNDAEFDEYIDYYFGCLSGSSDAIPNIESNKDQLSVLMFFQNFILGIIFNQVKLFLQNPKDEYEHTTRMNSLNFACESLRKYVLKDVTRFDIPDINLAFFNMAKLVKLTKLTYKFKEKFFITIFGYYMQSEKYRIDNQESMVDFLSAVTFLHDVNAITAMVNAIEFCQPFLKTLAANPDNKQKSKFCVFCRDLVMNCFIVPDDEKSGIGDVKLRGLNENGSRVIKFMYENEIFFFLCKIALFDDIFDVKVNSAAALGEISTVLPRFYLFELIMNHNFIEIYPDLISSDESIFKKAILAINSVLNLLDTFPTNNDGLKLYSKLADSNLLDEIENSGKTYDDEKLMNEVENVLKHAVIQKDRFTNFGPNNQ